MKSNTILLGLILAFFSWNLQAQEMQEGFTKLENGQFAEAEIFFKDILKDYPENKTAKLCYARAVGLHNDPLEAKNLFSDLLKDYPNDLEVQLNFAESLLWNQDYENARSYYEKLIDKNPDNFGALLGYANTLSNLKEYSKASETISQALLVSPDNPSAMISRKYIRLGYANQFQQERAYEMAHQLLDENLQDFPADKESLLNKANIYLIQKNADAAKSVYSELALNLNDSILAFNGISLASHIDGKEQEALDFAERALEISRKSEDSIHVLETQERYTQALIWNGQYKLAKKFIENLNSEYGQNTRILALKATLGMYTGDFKQSIDSYQRILEIDSASFDGDLGIANAYFARGEAKKAKQAAENTLDFYKNQQDAEQFLQKLNNTYSPILEENLSYSFDNGNNTAVASRTAVHLNFNPDLQFHGAYTYRKTQNKVTNMEANSNQVDIGLGWRLSPILKMRGAGGFVKASSPETDYTSAVGEVAAQIKPFTRDDLEIGFRKDIQDFNAELLNRQISANHIFLNNNYSTTYGLGWYLQYLHTEQSDENSRDLLFTSIYYSFLKKPLLKGGVNYQFITFKDQMPAVYFSPEKFQAVELFLNLLGNDSNSKFSYDLTAAAGDQFIESDPKQSTYRLQGRIGYHIGSRFQASLYGNHSNIASATAAGFTYTEFGLNLKWTFLQKPIFNW